MATTGNGPLWTDPAYCSDEEIAIIARGDFWTLLPHWTSLAEGGDGAFAADDPWTLTSATVDFETQGVKARDVVSLIGPKPWTAGSPMLMAVDSVAGNACTLRRIGRPLSVGQPPGPIGGASGVSFLVKSFGPEIDNATYRLKRLFAIDEMIAYRSSSWTYQGAEDLYRTFREACCQAVLREAYERETRDATNGGDFARKASLAARRYQEAVDAIQVRWGPTGSSAEATDVFGTMISR